jgi:hypothetical protein
MDIKLTDIIKISNPENYKLHLGSTDTEGNKPLDLYIENEDNWKQWNEYRGNKNDWNRDYIFSMIDFYPQYYTWLFGGIFKVIERQENKYILEEVEEYKKFDGRLLLNFERYQGLRGRAFLLEGFINDISVNQIFEMKYTGEVFPGYDNINHDFSALEPIFRIEKSDWKNALSNVKGIYIITDKKTGKSYIGSAYGEKGIWERWAQYINTCHGWDEQLITLIKKNGENYARENLKFSILEVFALYETNNQIIQRENYWKEKLMTRVFGYNSN